jgi:hypothetical protein
MWARRLLRWSECLSSLSAREDSLCQARQGDQEAGAEKGNEEAAPEGEGDGGKQDRREEPAEGGASDADKCILEAAESLPAHDSAGKGAGDCSDDDPRDNPAGGERCDYYTDGQDDHGMILLSYGSEVWRCAASG